MTGIPAVTIRVWERRYGIIAPPRSSGNYRLYSDRDVALLRWLKHEVDSGTPIRHAAARLTEMQGRGEWPEALPSLGPLPASPAAAERLSRRLFDSLVTADERGARAILRQAGTRYDLDTLCLRILTPCLVEIGEAWHRGEIRVAQEHFASAFLRAHLLSLYQTYPLRRNAPRAFVGCAPSEQHEIGALMVALFLRRGGCRVDYLGANLDAADLTAYARDQGPQLVALSAASDEAALALDPAARRLGGLKPSPLFVYGGRAFNQEPSLRQEIPGRFLGEDAASGARTALSLLHLR
jgi:DNA-binding transcriptional MerR regulator/methylmalonyl-CoA mutase cobalamin-binding subunit